jgi:hypothetical protein
MTRVIHPRKNTVFKQPTRTKPEDRRMSDESFVEA